MPGLARVLGLGGSCAARTAAGTGIALAGALTGWVMADGPASAQAEPLTLDGLTFSDEMGGIEIVDGWGTGTLDDPFVLVEEISEHEPAILVVRGMRHVFGNRIRSHHDVGFALTKIVRNRTEQTWSQFDLELREHLDQPSPFGDGLSFGQASEAGRPFTSDRFTEYVETHEPYDGVAFFSGSVAPGEAVMLSVVVTDTTPRYEFYLLQKRDSPLASKPGFPDDQRPDAGPSMTLVSALILTPAETPRRDAGAGPGDTRARGSPKGS